MWHFSNVFVYHNGSVGRRQKLSFLLTNDSVESCRTPKHIRRCVRTAYVVLCSSSAVSDDIDIFSPCSTIKHIQFKWNKFKAKCTRRALYAVLIWFIHPLYTTAIDSCLYSVYTQSFTHMILTAVEFINFFFQNLIHPIASNINSIHSTVCWISKFVQQTMHISFCPAIQMNRSQWLRYSSVDGEIRNQSFVTINRNQKLLNAKHLTFWMRANIVVSGFVSLKALSPLDVKMKLPHFYRGKIQIRSLWTSSVYALVGVHPVNGSLKVISFDIFHCRQ